MRFFVVGLFVIATVVGIRLTHQVLRAVAAAPESRPEAVVQLNVELSTAKSDQGLLAVRNDRSATPYSLAESQDAISSADSQRRLTSTADPLLESGVSNRDRLPQVGQPGPNRQTTPLHPQMLTPGNFVYLGGFRPPLTETEDAKFSFGGWAVTHHSGGDPHGPEDGYPGSLYLLGFQPTQLVAEISIPQPVQTRSIDALSVAVVLQPFGDVTGGMQRALTAGETEAFEIGGMQIVNDRLHWTLFKYYNVAGHDYPSHGTSSLRIDGSPADGLWHLGPMESEDPQWHSYKHAGYIAQIPDAEAVQWFGGRNLMSGLQISTGLQYSSQGPALFAYHLPEPGTPSYTSLDAVPLLWYSQERPLAGHHPADRWTGAAWLTLGDKQAVVIAGRKAHGAVHYGEPRANDCYRYKGYHGSSYEVQMLFYTSAELIGTANGRGQATQIDPWLRWDNQTSGGGIDRFMLKECGRDIGGMTYDRQNNLLYIVEVDAGFTSDNEWEPTPVIHTFRVVE